MSLWVALIWVVCAAICLGIFAFCRKCLADVAQHVSEEFQNRINKILEAERNAEDQLLEAFSSFGNSAQAIQEYQKTEAELFTNHQAKPLWNWSMDDVQIWRKRSEARERAGRGRPVILAVAVLILSLGIVSSVTSVIMLNNVNPVMMAQTSSVGTSSAAARQLPPSIALPPLPTAQPVTSVGDSADWTYQTPLAVSNTIADSNTVSQPHNFK